MNAQSLLSLLYKKGITLAVEQEDLLIEDVNNALDSDLISLIKQYKKALVSLLSKLNTSAFEAKQIERRVREYPFQFDCSYAQKRMLFMESLAGEQSFYNLPFAYKISGLLDIQALNKALISLVNKHDVLRTIYLLQDDEYIQQVNPFVSIENKKFSIEIKDISDAIDIDSCIKEYLKEYAQYRFNLQEDYPIQAVLLKVKENEFILSLNIHHIAADGWSAHKVISDLNEGYRFHLNQANEALNNNQKTVESANELQYVDYINWQEQWLKSDAYRAAKNYWLEALGNLPELHNFPTDYVRPATLGVEGETYTQRIDSALITDLHDLSKKHQTTSFVLIQAAFAAFLARFTDDTDIVFGTAVANRQPSKFTDVVGLFVNTLVLRYAIDENGDSLTDLITQAKSVNKNALKYQQFPFDKLVEELQPKRSLGYNPLVQIMLVMQDDGIDLLKLADVETDVISQYQAVSKFDFTLHVKLSAHRLTINWEYNKSLFKDKTIKNIASQFEYFLATALSAPEKNTNDLNSLLPDAIIPKPNAQLFPAPSTIHQLFEDNVKQVPDTLALTDENSQLTYQELNESADIVAAHLASLCQVKGERIAVCMEKSIELVIGMLAVFKMGGIYVPIDPSYPQERIDHMLEDSSVKILLSNKKTNLSIEQQAIDIHLVEGILAQPKVKIEISPVKPTQAAYIIYTSGSTGKPKGVEVSHQSLFYSLQANKAEMEFDGNDIMPTVGSQAFGVSLLEILLPLISAAQVRIVTQQQVRDVEQLIQYTDKVTVLHAVPSIMSQWLEYIENGELKHCYANLRLLLVGAEPVSDTLIKRIKQWRPNIKLQVLYGMTESSVVSSSYEGAMQGPSCYCIGRPHGNTQFYVLNKQQKIQPQGVPGELYVGGLSLASGYLNQAELTREKFISSPFHQGERLYRTGDRVRCLSDGNHEFLGRIDNQVSLRGVRIELGEIESIVVTIEGIKQALAHVMTMNNGERTLVLYYTAEHKQIDEPELSKAIRSRLAKKLPEYMIPSVIQYLAKFPLNPNGKVDRSKLPQPVFDHVIIEPMNDIEQQLLMLWQEVLQNQNISVEDNFFEIGGHSLIATKLIARVRSQFSVSIPLTALFKSPTIRSCATLLEQKLQEQYSLSLINNDSEQESSELVDEIII